MTSDSSRREAFVWVWLPDAVEPVVAGRLSADGDRLVFNYGKSYLARDDAIALYAPELPLRPGLIPLLPGLHMPACLRDGAPDAWGRRVIINRLLGVAGGSGCGEVRVRVGGGVGLGIGRGPGNLPRQEVALTALVGEDDAVLALVHQAEGPLPALAVAEEVCP